MPSQVPLHRSASESVLAFHGSKKFFLFCFFKYTYIYSVSSPLGHPALILYAYDWVAACLRFTLCLLSLGGDEARQWARLGTTGGMLAGTAGVSLPNAHTQRSHQNKQTSVQLRTLLPPTLFQRVINLLFFPLLVIFLCALRDESMTFTLSPFAAIFCLFLFFPIFILPLQAHHLFLPLCPHTCCFPHSYPFLSLHR